MEEKPIVQVKRVWEQRNLLMKQDATLPSAEATLIAAAGILSRELQGIGDVLDAIAPS